MRKRLLLVAALVGALAAVIVLAVGAGRFGDDEPGAEGRRSPPLTSFDGIVSGVGFVQILNCDGEPLIVDDGVTQHGVSGTGFLVGSRVLMTAEHVAQIPIRNPNEACGVRVRLSGRWYDVAEAKAWGEPGEDDRRGLDLATLTLAEDAPGHIFDFAPETERVGKTVSLIGHPGGARLTISKGVITRKVVDYEKPRMAVRFVPQGEGGSSGGPIVNNRGEVVSVASGIIISANLTSDGKHRGGGVDLPLWWGEAVRDDLCLAHPDGGIPACDAGSLDEATKAPVDLSLPR